MSCRLLYLVGQLGPGGLERQLYYLLQEMDRVRYRPAIVIWNFSDTDSFVRPIQDLRVSIHALPAAGSRLHKLKAVRRLVTQLQPEVVHSYSFFTNFAASWATLGTPAIALGSVRGDLLAEKTRAGPWLGRLSGFWPRAQIYNNFSAAESARRSGSPFVPGWLTVVRNGLDLHRFYSTVPVCNGEVRILGVGSLLPVKRWDRLLRLALNLKGLGYRCRTRIAGNGPLREQLISQAQDCGIADRVEFLGHVEDVTSLMADSSFLVHSSDSEGRPNAVMEAMACGRAVVATDVGDIPILVENEKTGFVVPREDEKLLLARVMTLIDQPSLCRKMGEAGRFKADQHFGLDRLLAETFDAYKAVGWQSD